LLDNLAAMRYPNLIVVGAQKCGTTWLHKVLGRSESIFASRVKELNHFSRPSWTDPDKLAAYAANFDTDGSYEYYLESSPSYFVAPRRGLDIPRGIAEVVGNPKLLVALRDPVDRYESAHTHHVMQGRIEYSPTIHDVSDDYSMLSLGMYATHLAHWRSVFPDLKVIFHDDIADDPAGVIDDIMNWLGVPNDLKARHLRARPNSKDRKHRKLGLDWVEMPTLSLSARRQLVDHYADQVEQLSAITGRDLSHWLRVEVDAAG
jgi:hypothetical protein